MSKFIVHNCIENESDSYLFSDCKIFVCSRCDVNVIGELTIEHDIDVFDGRDSSEIYEHVGLKNIEGVRVETSDFCWDCMKEINECKLIDDLIESENK